MKKGHDNSRYRQRDKIYEADSVSRDQQRGIHRGQERKEDQRSHTLFS